MSNQNTIDCLLFEVAGIAFGADVSQIARIDDAPASGADEDAVSFRMALGIKGELNRCKKRSLLRMKGVAAGSMLVEGLEGIEPISTEEFQPLPEILRKAAANPYLKAVALHGSRVIFLVDMAEVASMAVKY